MDESWWHMMSHTRSGCNVAVLVAVALAVAVLVAVAVAQQDYTRSS